MTSKTDLRSKTSAANGAKGGRPARPTAPLLKDLWSVSIHPTTGQEIGTGTLPVGTKVIDPQAVFRRINEYELEQVTFDVIDETGFHGRERACASSLLAALVTYLPTPLAPPTKEPVMIGGAYELIDGTFAKFCWVDGQCIISRRVPKEMCWAL